MQEDGGPSSQPTMNGHSSMGPAMSRQDSRNNAMASIRNMLQKEPEMSDEKAMKLAGSVLEDVLNGQVSFSEAADQWYGKSIRVKGEKGATDEYYERIPVKNLSAIIVDRLETIIISGKEQEQQNFGILMRYLIFSYSELEILINLNVNLVCFFLT